MELSLVTFCIEDVPRKSSFSVIHDTYAKSADIQSIVGALLYTGADNSYFLPCISVSLCVQMSK